MGSDCLAGSVCCDSSLVRVQSPSPQCCVVNNDVGNIADQFEPNWDPENISEEDRAKPVQAWLLQDDSEWYVFFVCCF